MGRQQRFDWFLSNQANQRRITARGNSGRRGRRPRFETLEVRNFLSINSAMGCTEIESEVTAAFESDSLNHHDFQPHALWASREEYQASNDPEPIDFVAFDPWEDNDPDEPGITITYSYSNLLDGQLPGGLQFEELTTATEEALGLWAEFAPIHFVELLDSGPPPSDQGYDGDGLPMLRIGHHPIDGSGGVLAHAFLPQANGLGGDIHFDSLDTWRVSPAGLGFDLLEVMTHELGHSLGLGHETVLDAIMNPFYSDRFDGLGTGFLLQDDINGIQELYGTGEGSVTPLVGLIVDTLEDVDDITFSVVDGETVFVDGSPDTLALREAISIANSEGGVRPINFDRDIRDGTIILDDELGSLEIKAGITIIGLDSNITVSAANPDLAVGEGFRIFNIDNDDPMDNIPDTVVDVSISGLTLTGGLAKSGPMAMGGGAILSRESLTLTGMTFLNNTSELEGGAVWGQNSTTIMESTFEDNTAERGGAVYVDSGGVTSTENTYLRNHAETGRGGAIDSFGSVTSTEDTFSENTAVSNGGAVYSTGTVSTFESVYSNNTATEGDGGAIVARFVALDNSTFEGNVSGDNGGAIYSNRTGAMISESTFLLNFAGNEGGAFYADVDAGRDVEIEGSTFYENESVDDGGAIAARGANSNLTIVNSTISGNTAGRNGGGINIFAENPERFRVLHSTVFDNHADRFGGGIYMLDGVLALEHSIVASNSDSGPAPDIDNINFFATPIVLTRYSLIGDIDGALLTQQGPNLLNVDAMLEPLADNGGPTLTHFPMSGSPIVNAGNPNVSFPPDFDQRGTDFERIIEGVIDIGAIETGGFENSLTVNTLADQYDIDGNGEDQTPETTSLREALYFADLDLGKTRVDFDPSLLGGIMELDSSLGELTIRTSTAVVASDLILGLTISGAAADPTPEVKNGDGIRLLNVADGDDESIIEAELVGIQLVGGDVAGNGGGIHSTESLILRDVMVLDNSATGNGGGVYQDTGTNDSTLNIEGSTLARNRAGLDGGGLWTDTTIPSSEDYEGVKLLNSTVSANVAGDEGGGIMNQDGLMEILHSTITENEAVHGSGVVTFGDVFTSTQVYSSIISGNVYHPNDTGFDVQISRNLAYNAFVSLGYNMIGIGNAALNFDNDDLVEVIDPKLRPLGNYGGKTLTHALFPDSPATEAGDPSLPSAGYTDGILADEPLLYWPFDEEVGTTAEDLAGDNDGTYGDQVTIDQDGPRSETGRAVALNGSEDFSSIESDEIQLVETGSLGDEYSFSLWMNANTDNRLQMLFQLDDPNASAPEDATAAQLRWSSGEIVVKGPNAEMSTDLNLGNLNWYHVVFAQDGDESRIYVNGILRETESGLDFGINVDTRVLIGNQLEEMSETSEGFAGQVDEFIIYDTALNDQSVAILYRSSSTPDEDIVSQDQRGESFDRIIDLNNDGEPIVDIGAYELAQPTPTADFNEDRDVDGADFLTWQRGFGMTDAQLSDGDSDFDGDVDADDLGTWTGQYGEITPVPLNYSEALPSSSHRSELQVPATAHEVVRSDLQHEVSRLAGILSAHERSLRDVVTSSDDDHDQFEDSPFGSVENTPAGLVEILLVSPQPANTGSRVADSAPDHNFDDALDTAFEQIDLRGRFGQYEL